MNAKLRLLNIPVFLAAAAAILRLAGIPGKLHLTAARILFILLTLSIVLLWLILFRYREKITAGNHRAFYFQSVLFLTLICCLLPAAGSRLSASDGMLYRAGAFIRQALPFWIFLAVTGLCTLILLACTLRETGSASMSALFTESTALPCGLVIFAAILLVFGAFCPLRANYYPSHDYAIFAYIGQQILRGKIPYTQLWDHKPPVIFYLNALGLKLAGGDLIGIWLLEVAAFLAGSLILFRLLSKRYPRWISLAVLSTGILQYVRVLDFGNYTEEVSLFFVLCSLGLFFGKSDGRHPVFRGILNGILCGLAFTSKQNTVGCWAALFAVDLIRTLPFGKDQEKFRERRDHWLGAAAGFLAVNAAWVIYFAANHALTAYWDVAFWFNWIYSERSGSSRLACAWTTLTFLPSVSFWLLFGYISWFAAVFRIHGKGIRSFIEKDPLCAWAVIALPVELICAGLSGMNYQHYFILCITPLIILLCAALDFISGSIGSRRPAVFRFGTILILCASCIPLISCFEDNYMPRTPSSYTKIRNYLISDTIPDEPILVWGSRSAIYVMSERYAPTAYFNERPLYLFPGDVRASQWNEMLQDLQNDPPQVIINTRDSALPFIKDEENGCILPDMADYTVPLYNYFCDNYQYETTINPEFLDAWEIYRRR